MSITIKQAASALGISEDEVNELVSSGKLRAERKGGCITIDESDLRALFSAPGGVGASGGGHESVFSADALTGPVLDRLAALEKEISDKLSLLDESRRLLDELRRKDREIALRETEIEKLKRDLVYQKKLLEKEIEDRARVLEEKRAAMDREISERISRERDESEKRLALERSAWSERLAAEREKAAASLADMRSKEGFWARMLRLLTWS